MQQSINNICESFLIWYRFPCPIADNCQYKITDKRLLNQRCLFDNLDIIYDEDYDGNENGDDNDDDDDDDDDDDGGGGNDDDGGNGDYKNEDDAFDDSKLTSVRDSFFSIYYIFFQTVNNYYCP